MENVDFKKLKEEVNKQIQEIKDKLDSFEKELNTSYRYYDYGINFAYINKLERMENEFELEKPSLQPLKEYLEDYFQDHCFNCGSHLEGDESDFQKSENCFECYDCYINDFYNEENS